MCKIDIIIPFAGAEKYVGNWAREESYIDFIKEPAKATRCTVAYAAEELKNYLAKTLIQADIRYAAKESEDRLTFWLAWHRRGSGRAYF